MADSGLQFTCTLGDLPPMTFAVADFTLTEALSTPFTLAMTLSSPRADIDPDALLLQPGSMTLTRNGVPQRTVNGVIAQIIQGEYSLNHTRYQVVLSPPMWRLTLTQNSRIFHKKSVPEILKILLDEHDLLSDCTFYDEHATREYVTQKRESDFDFFARLAAEEGITFWFEETLVRYSDRRMGMRMGPEGVFNPQPGVTVDENIVSRLSWGRTARPQDTIQKDRWHGHPNFAMSYTSKTNPRKPEPGKLTVFDSTGRFQDDDTGKLFTGYRRDVLSAETQYGQAGSNCIKLMPGRLFHLSGHPLEKRNTSYLVVSVTHHGQVPEVLGNGGSGTTFSNSLQLISGYDTWRPAFRHKPLADGDEVATVVGPAGEEIYVNEMGAIKVHFHWNRYDQPDENASCWVRVAQAWNGNGYGFLATPRIGQEVIISYLNGDVDRPIVTGCNYNAVNKTPLTLPKNMTQTTLRTKTHKGKGFNELRFEDEKDKEEIYIHGQKDMNTVILDNRTTTVGTDHTETIGKNQVVLVKHNQAETVFIAKALTVGAGFQTTVGGAMNTTVGLSQTEQVGIHKSVTVGKSLTISAGDVIELVCGKSVLRMDSAGKVTINGTEFDFEASGPVQITGKDVDLN